MSNLEHYPIVSEMKGDRDYIENYELETDKGTKRMKERFYETAATSLNQFIYDKRKNYVLVEKALYDEIARRFPLLMPVDSSEVYEKMNHTVSDLLYLVQLNSNCSNSFKLKIDYIIASINDLTSLEDLNQKINFFIHRFKEFGIGLNISDFTYTMFTEMYMNTFFENPDYDAVKETFEDIYFKCPDIKLQLKMNLKNIVEKYDKQLGEYVILLKNKMMNDYSIPPTTDIISHYVQNRFELGDGMATDAYYNTKAFIDGKKKIVDYLEGSTTRVKIYNSFALNDDYYSYNDEEKKLYNESLMSFYLTLNELKKFYKYEFILQDLISFYKDKASAKGAYTSKKKEIEKEEKKRIALNNQYKKACGIGFLAKVSPNKQKFVMLQMNNHIRHLRDLYQELDDLEIRYQVSNLTDSSSIYDLFLVSLSSFAFLEKCFQTEGFDTIDLEENIVEYLRFIYNPNNSFLRKVNGLVDYNITDIVADKYRLLNVDVTAELIQAENIDSTLQDVQFINLIQNIERSKITLSQIHNLCRMHEIIVKSENE
ncbi:MAG: hypothetical protein J6X28_03490 [Bacilli bacterium]|nr:hypothetical protein [Bacilli bacterium]